MSRTTTISGQQSRRTRLVLHLAVLVVLLVAAIAMATFAGGLWPFDLRFSALIALGGIAVLAIAWWPAALALGLISALLPLARLRLVFWPVAVLAMIVLHGAFGPGLGFVPLGTLGVSGAVALYAIPTALPILVGSALREAFFQPSAPVERSSP